MSIHLRCDAWKTIEQEDPLTEMFPISPFPEYEFYQYSVLVYPLLLIRSIEADKFALNIGCQIHTLDGKYPSSSELLDSHCSNWMRI